MSFVKTLRVFLIVTLLHIPFIATAKVADKVRTAPERVPGEYVVKLKKGIDVQTASLVDMARMQILGAEAFETNERFVLVKTLKSYASENVIEELRKNPNVLYAEPNYIYSVNYVREATLPNDARFAELWGLHNTGQEVSGANGIAGADIGVTKVWGTHTGSRNIVVAVIDTGIDHTHADLANNIYVNPNEIPDNGIDDDGNGFIDDVRGWNFAGVSNNNAMDDNDHGTHVAGTIGASGNDGIGVAGVNWKVSMMPVKFLSASGSGTLADAVKSIQYATKMRVNIMNNSWGGGGFSQALMDAIEEANQAGIIFVAAAGNNGTNNDQAPHYPSNYQVENVVSVAATTNQEELASFSCFGKRTVHIAAPGHRILSTTPNNAYQSFSGTSMATPHVVGALALLWSTNESQDYKSVINGILQSTDKLDQYQRFVSTGGRLNVYNAVNGIYPPSRDIPDSAWQDFALAEVIETEHPYKKNTQQEWEIRGPENAKYIRLVFSKFHLETRFDTLSLIGAGGRTVDKLTGQLDDNAVSWHVDGNSARILFKSDSSVEKWGFRLEKIQFVPHE